MKTINRKGPLNRRKSLGRAGCPECHGSGWCSVVQVVAGQKYEASERCPCVALDSKAAAANDSQGRLS